MEIGIVSFGTLEQDAQSGRYGSSGAAQRHLVEAIKLADEVGLDFFGIGEHHLPSMPVSQPAAVLAAAAQVTHRIRLGSAITVLGADDAVRVFEQYATLDGLSNGRAEITVGAARSWNPSTCMASTWRGMKAFAEKLDLLAHLTDAGPSVTWEGKLRAPLENADIQPRPDQDWLPVWLATGGKPGSIVRAAKYHLLIMFSDIGSDPAGFGRLAGLYREAFHRRGEPRRTHESRNRWRRLR